MRSCNGNFVYFFKCSALFFFGHEIFFFNMESHYLKINRLQGAENWTKWKFRMKQFLESIDVYEVVSGDELRPVLAEDAEAAARSAHTTALAAWKKKDAKARGMIAEYVAEQPIVHIMNCDTSKDMWTSLKNVYEPTNVSNVLFLQQRYYSLKKEATDDMATFLAKFLDVVQQLKDLNSEISDSMVMTKIQMALPPEYNYFHSAWDSTATAERTLSTLKSRLILEETRLKAQGTVETVEALMVKSNLGNPKRKQNSKPKKKKSEKKEKGACFNCGKTDHWKRDCKEPRKSKEQAENKSGESSTGAFMCETVCSMNSVGDRDAWVLDSGASDHMSHRSEWFVNMTEISTAVTIGDGRRIMAKGRGDVNILAFDGVNWIPKRIADVLYVPDLHLNLFSSGRAMDRGHRLASTNSRCELLRDGFCVAVGVRRNGLFQMLFRTVWVNEHSANVATKSLSLRVWHERLGHQNVKYVKKFLTENDIEYVNDDFTCEACVLGKQHRLSFGLREERATKCGEIIHSDVCGPLPTESLGGSRYFLTFRDDHSRYRFVYFLKHKSEVFEKFKHVVALAKMECGHDIKILRSDNGTEYVNKEMKHFMDEKGIRHQRTVPYTPEQNGCAERDNRTLKEAARTMILSKNLDQKFWAEAVNSTVYILNRTGRSTVDSKTPYELWHGKKTEVGHFRIFGSEVFVHVPKEKRGKMDAKSVKCSFVGYDENVKGYRVWNPITNKIEVARDVIFLIEEPVVLEIENDASTDGIKMESSEDEIEADAEDPEGDAEDDVNSSDNDDYESAPASPVGRNGGDWCNVDERNVIGRRLRDRNGNQRRDSCCAAGTEHAMMAMRQEPKTYEQAIRASDGKRWKEAMDEEYHSLVKNGTWKLVSSPTDQKVIDNRWVFKLKQNTDGSIERYKARLVVRGFTQESITRKPSVQL